MIYSKTLQLKDYDELPTAFIDTRYDDFVDICRFEHPHRKWEYGMALKSLIDTNTKTVLEVGGGGSLLLPLMYIKGMTVTEVDPYDCSSELRRQAERLRLSSPIEFIHKDFLKTDLNKTYDAVVCTSVIEHVTYHQKFFQKLLEYVKLGGILILTTDFYPERTTFSINHKRTYTKDMLLGYKKSAKGFDFLGGEYNYTFWGNYVYQYTFATLVLENVGV